MAVIGDKDLITFTVNKNTVRIRQSCLRPLDITELSPISHSCPAVYRYLVKVFAGYKKLVILTIQEDSGGTMVYRKPPQGRYISISFKRKNACPLVVAADRIELFVL